MKLAFFPVAKNAPPRPRRLAAFSSSITHPGSCARALASASKPPISRYSASLVRSCSSAPPRTTIGRSATAQLLHDRGDVPGLHGPTVVVVDRDDRRPAAAAEALDCAQGELAVLGRLARPYAELALERLEHRLGPAQRAADVRADLDQVPPARTQVEHVVEGRDRLAVGRREAERVADLLERLRGEPAAVPPLREPARGQDRRARLRILLRDLSDLVRERPRRHQRSTSPMTVSSDPTMAIMSATYASAMQVAVASSATNEGARNLTRHGLGPPSETT